MNDTHPDTHPTPQAPGAPQEPRIVVGVDGTAGSKDALRWARRLADATGASIDAVCAWQLPMLVGPHPVPPPTSPRQEATRQLRHAVRDVFGPVPPDDVTQRTVEGKPAEVLVREARGALMLVVGSRGEGRLRGLLLGSISQTVAELAPCPVLVVHPDHPVRRDRAAS